MKKKKYGKVIFNASILILSVGLLVYFCVSENGLVDLAKNINEFRKEWLVSVSYTHLDVYKRQLL